MVHHRAVFIERLYERYFVNAGYCIALYNYDYNPIMLAIQLMEQNQKKKY